MLGLALVLASSSAATAAQPDKTKDAWPTGGQNLQNTRSQDKEKTIGVGNASSLAPKWIFKTGLDTTTGGDVSATPAVVGDTVYFPDSKGSLFAVDRATGTVKWQSNIAAATGIAGDYARATPAIDGNTLIIGDQAGKFLLPTSPAATAGAYVMGFNRATGQLRWKTRVEPHFSAFVTQSAQVADGVAYVGVASNEEAFANQFLSGGVPYECCSFRGSVVALDVNTGAIKWKTYTLPDEPGYSGAAVWGSTPAVDAKRNAVYVATGNNYSLPPARSDCVNNAATDAEKRACLPGDHFDAIVAMDRRTGAIKWSYVTLPSDAWNTDCGLPGVVPGGTNPGNCPEGAGPDHDFGQGPMLFDAKVGGKKADLIGAGAKSGVFTTLDRDTGALVWNKQVGPGGLLGGMQWGSATDGKRIYVAESNSTGLQRGWWAALDAATGDQIWKTDDPSPGLPSYYGIFGYSAQGPTAVANGVVYGCSLSPEGTMAAMDSATGEIKWTYASGASCIGGAAIADGTVYWGNGYRTFAPVATAGNSLFAFTPGGA
jgi:polyvinyl alcohol dehydrogenase (cytochrome)